MTQFRTILIVDFNWNLSFNVDILPLQTVNERFLVNLLGITALEVSVNCETRLSNDVTQRVNVFEQRVGTQKAQEAQEVYPFCAFCAFCVPTLLHFSHQPLDGSGEEQQHDAGDNTESAHDSEDAG